MNEHLKQRLVGAIILIALAVIFVPMLLDGKGDSTMPTFGSNVPPRPGYTFEPLEIPLEVPPEAPSGGGVVVQSPAEASKGEGTAPAMAPAPAPVISKAPPSDGDPPAWVVQVGSFTKADNAFALRDKLRAKGFTAYVEEVPGERGTNFRVRVGPELKQENALALKEKLSAKAGVTGMVVRHP